MGCRRAVLIIAQSLLLICAAGVNAAAGDEPGAGSQPTATSDPFDQGSWTLQLYSSYHWRCGEDKGGNTFTAAAGISKYFADNWSIGVEGVYYSCEKPATPGVGANLMLRWHLFRDDKLTIFIDGGGGVFEGKEEVPVDGTQFNFTGLFGVGGTYHLFDNVYLMTGARYFHLSNAFIEGRGKNPSIDSIGMFAGLMFSIQ